MEQDGGYCTRSRVLGWEVVVKAKASQRHDMMAAQLRTMTRIPARSYSGERRTVFLWCSNAFYVELPIRSTEIRRSSQRKSRHKHILSQIAYWMSSHRSSFDSPPRDLTLPSFSNFFRCRRIPLAAASNNSSGYPSYTLNVTVHVVHELSGGVV